MCHLAPTVEGPLEPTDGVKVELSLEATTVHAFPVHAANLMTQVLAISARSCSVCGDS